MAPAARNLTPAANRALIRHGQFQYSEPPCDDVAVGVTFHGGCLYVETAYSSGSKRKWAHLGLDYALSRRGFKVCMEGCPF